MPIDISNLAEGDIVVFNSGEEILVTDLNYNNNNSSRYVGLHGSNYTTSGLYAGAEVDRSYHRHVKSVHSQGGRQQLHVTPIKAVPIRTVMSNSIVITREGKTYLVVDFHHGDNASTLHLRSLMADENGDEIVVSYDSLGHSPSSSDFDAVSVVITPSELSKRATYNLLKPTPLIVTVPDEIQKYPDIDMEQVRVGGSIMSRDGHKYTIIGKTIDKSVSRGSTSVKLTLISLQTTSRHNITYTKNGGYRGDEETNPTYAKHIVAYAPVGKSLPFRYWHGFDDVPNINKGSAFYHIDQAEVLWFKSATMPKTAALLHFVDGGGTTYKLSLDACKDRLDRVKSMDNSNI